MRIKDFDKPFFERIKEPCEQEIKNITTPYWGEAEGEIKVYKINETGEVFFKLSDNQYLRNFKVNNNIYEVLSKFKLYEFDDCDESLCSTELKKNEVILKYCSQLKAENDSDSKKQVVIFGNEIYLTNNMFGVLIKDSGNSEESKKAYRLSITEASTNLEQWKELGFSDEEINTHDQLLSGISINIESSYLLTLFKDFNYKNELHE